MTLTVVSSTLPSYRSGLSPATAARSNFDPTSEGFPGKVEAGGRNFFATRKLARSLRDSELSVTPLVSIRPERAKSQVVQKKFARTCNGCYNRGAKHNPLVG